MTEMYGQSFVREHGTDPNEVWINVVAKLSNAEIINGLEVLGHTPRDYPPNVTIFRDACFDRHTLASGISQRALPPPRTNADRRADAAAGWDNLDRLAGFKHDRTIIETGPRANPSDLAPGDPRRGAEGPWDD